MAKPPKCVPSALLKAKMPKNRLPLGTRLAVKGVQIPTLVLNVFKTARVALFVMPVRIAFLFLKHTTSTYQNERV